MGIGVSLLRRHAKPLSCLGRIPRDPLAIVIHHPKIELSTGLSLFERRTVVWFKNMLMGRPEHLGPLLEASLSLQDASYGNGEILSVSINNNSDADFFLRNKSKYGFYDGHTDIIVVAQHTTVTLQVKTGKKVRRIELEFEVLNALTAPRQTASIMLEARVE